MRSYILGMNRRYAVVALLMTWLTVTAGNLVACGSGIPPSQLVKEWPRDRYLLLASSRDAAAYKRAATATSEIAGKVNLALVDTRMHPGAGASQPYWSVGRAPCPDRWRHAARRGR